MNRSMSVPLAFAVPFENEPLGSTLSRWPFAQFQMIGKSVVCTWRRGEVKDVSTASRARMRRRYASAWLTGGSSSRAAIKALASDTGGGGGASSALRTASPRKLRGGGLSSKALRRRPPRKLLLPDQGALFVAIFNPTSNGVCWHMVTTTATFKMRYAGACRTQYLVSGPRVETKPVGARPLALVPEPTRRERRRLRRWVTAVDTGPFGRRLGVMNAR